MSAPHFGQLVGVVIDLCSCSRPSGAMSQFIMLIDEAEIGVAD